MNIIYRIDQDSLNRSILLTLNGWTGHSSLLNPLFKATGAYSVYLVPFLLVGLWLWFTYGKGTKDSDRRTWKMVVLEAVIAGLLAGFIINPIVGHFFYVPRPFAGIGRVREVLIHRPDRSFPSDHASFLFGVGFYFLYAGWKCTGWWVLDFSLLVGFGRIILGIHYPFDILGDFVIGAVSAWILYVLRDYIEAYFARPVIRVAGWLGL